MPAAIKNRFQTKKVGVLARKRGTNQRQGDEYLIISMTKPKDKVV